MPAAPAACTAPRAEVMQGNMWRHPMLVHPAPLHHMDINLHTVPYRPAAQKNTGDTLELGPRAREHKPLPRALRREW